jgi:hypothetical protein
MKTWHVLATELAAAVEAYDLAIQSCANDPQKMASFCTAQGDTLDTLYAAMLEAAEAIHGDRRQVWLEDFHRLLRDAQPISGTEHVEAHVEAAVDQGLFG